MNDCHLKISILDEDEEIIAIHDSFLTSYDIELFYCKGNLFKGRWFQAETIPPNVLNKFRESHNQSKSSSTCNTDKTSVYSCIFKLKTCGVLLACSNCGIILNFKEFYGAESCSQVALFYLETTQNFTSKSKFIPFIF